ncbi:MAG: HEPN domain-containing protein [Candidatus Scalindua rubra]|uniref:HEPN domain-containing protein n=1 Tax=Candidatus Scalindua brodae TaxID=237368 RepID=A0A0B0ETD2_9BACT|nr:MAG: hypothetical protein SCABRO_00314 [Candidatus Scalindua brodae]MBZ0108001.1 HEPN domain-containing protein [Candidatus Scalindua rubra]TWU28769.1 hypothetical protein S225a_27960 [Candidatus Brocadiaceae bacterium S225]
MIGKDFLTFAKTICRNDDEAARRTAVSRSYYALFHEVRSIVISAGIRIEKDASAHMKLVRYLKETGKGGIDDAKLVGKKLEDLREIRNAADYDLDDTAFNSKNTCALQYALAESSRNKLLSINNADLKRGLVAYARSVREY